MQGNGSAAQVFFIHKVQQIRKNVFELPVTFASATSFCQGNHSQDRGLCPTLSPCPPGDDLQPQPGAHSHLPWHHHCRQCPARGQTGVDGTCGPSVTVTSSVQKDIVVSLPPAVTPPWVPPPQDPNCPRQPPPPPVSLPNQSLGQSTTTPPPLLGKPRGPPGGGTVPPVCPVTLLGP